MTGIRSQIVVGLDGSPESLTAARWAAHDARLRGLSLHLVHTYSIPAVGMIGYTVPTALTDGLYATGEQILADARTELYAAHPDLEITDRLVQADPRPVLVQASRGAALTVVGTRGGGRIPDVVLGSVAVHVAAHAHSPVAVIPNGSAAPSGADGPVRLGVDGSRISEAAVEFAFDEADRRRVPLQAVIVWDDADLRGLVAAGTPLDLVEDGKEHALLAEQLAGWRDKYPDVVVEPVVRRGRAAEALLRADAAGPDPQMIVVGSRGRGGFAGLLLGSTSHSLIGHSRWPVLVVRPHAR
ncbi:universal stress protein [Nakamurella sp.]|uniref:universal stress protein n=1 Tax=Nakamurella sp. TaxID=1869182 RepID=UPI003782FBA5